ncbi:MAG: hypothetical protein ACE5HE_01695 [Phycisphaerae bacterium]
MSRRGNAYTQDRVSVGAAASAPTGGADDTRPLAEISKNLHECLRILGLHRWAFFIPFCLVAGGVFILSLYYPRTYWASTTFERRNDPILADLEMSQGAAMFKLFSTTIARDMTSLEYMTEVIDRIGLIDASMRNDDDTLTEAGLQHRRALAHELGRRISLKTRQPNDQVDIIDVTYTGPDPNIGQKLLDAIKAVYISRTMDWVQQHLDGLRDYYAAERAEALEELRAAEREQTRLRLENPLLDPRDPGAISAKIFQLEMEKGDLLRRRREHQTDLEAQKQMLAVLESGSASDDHGQGTDKPPTYISPETRHLLGVIDGIDKQIKTLTTTRGMTRQHPEIQELLASRQRRSADLEAQRARDREYALRAGQAIESAARAKLASRVEVPPALAGEQARLLAQINGKEAQIADLDLSLELNERKTLQLTEAKTRVFALQEAYADNAGRIAKARQRYGSHVAMLGKIEPAIRVNRQNKLLHWSLGEPARGRYTPIDPKAKTIVLLALLAGAVAGVAFVILAEVFDHAYRCAAQVSRSLGMPILSTIDEIITARQRRRLLIRRVVLVPVVVAICLGFAGVSGSLAYVSLQMPATYRKLQGLPRSAFELLASNERSRERAVLADLPSS